MSLYFSPVIFTSGTHIFTVFTPLSLSLIPPQSNTSMDIHTAGAYFPHKPLFQYPAEIASQVYKQSPKDCSIERINKFMSNINIAHLTKKQETFTPSVFFQRLLKNKAPFPNGIPADFYRSFNSNLIICVQQNCSRNRCHLQSSLNEGYFPLLCVKKIWLY